VDWRSARGRGALVLAVALAVLAILAAWVVWYAPSTAEAQDETTTVVGSPKGATPGTGGDKAKAGGGGGKAKAGDGGGKGGGGGKAKASNGSGGKAKAGGGEGSGPTLKAGWPEELPTHRGEACYR